jgi:hypothetical protein
MSDKPSDINIKDLTKTQEKIVVEQADYWRKVSQELPLQSMARVEEAARQVIGLNGTIQALYLAAFAFSNLRTQAPGNQIWLFLLPVFCWSLSMLFATLVYLPWKRQGANLDDISEEAWMELRTTVNDAVNAKRRMLYAAYGLLILSFVLVLSLLILFFSSDHPKPAPDPQPFVLLTPTPAPATPTITP